VPPNYCLRGLDAIQAQQVVAAVTTTAAVQTTSAPRNRGGRNQIRAGAKSPARRTPATNPAAIAKKRFIDAPF